MVSWINDALRFCKQKGKNSYFGIQCQKLHFIMFSALIITVVNHGVCGVTKHFTKLFLGLEIIYAYEA